jgi:hypothetical protein
MRKEMTIMPYDIKQNYGGCDGYAVVGPDGDVKGCHSTREKAQSQQRALYASESKVNKYSGMLYDQLRPSEKSLHDAMISLVTQYGPFDREAADIYVAYEDSRENEDAGIGVKCSNCSLFNPSTNGCAILSYEVEPEGKCRFAIIPDGYVNAPSQISSDVATLKSVWLGNIDPRNARRKTF